MRFVKVKILWATLALLSAGRDREIRASKTGGQDENRKL